MAPMRAAPQSQRPHDRGITRPRRRRPALLCATALVPASLLAWAAPARAQPAVNARPTGGQVVAGTASIGYGTNTTSINQSSQRAAINWGSFNVGAAQSVVFHDPNASAATLNRVVGADPSAIAGRIISNGQVFIINQSGVVFYQGSQVNAAALVVSTPGMSNSNFMAGRMVFDQPGKAGAAIVNAGTLTVRQAGLAALVAPQVANSGTINAHLGHVVLAGAQAATLDLYGDGLVSIDVTRAVRQLPGGASALVTNTGAIRADGGTVQLTARAADGVVRTLVDADGSIRANTADGHTGTIEIEGTGGSILIAGSLHAEGKQAGSKGGQIELNATGTVTLAHGARVNASGSAGGGLVAIGTTLARAAGGPGVTGQATARRTVIERGARVSADASFAGNGGDVTLLSTHATFDHGYLSARGGAFGGNGGWIEISSVGRLGLTGGVDAGAAHGALGSILLDPTNLDITDGAAPPGFSKLTTAEVEAMTGNVLISATNTLEVMSNLQLNPKTVQSFTLQAGNELIIGADINANVIGVDLIGGAGGILLSAGTLTTTNLTLNATGAIVQTGGVIDAGVLFATGSSLSLPQPNVIPNIDNINTTTGDVTVTEAPGQALDLFGTIAVPNGHAITLNADQMTFGFSVPGGLALAAPGGTITLAPVTANRPEELIASGNANPNALSISTFELATIETGTLVLGSPTTGIVNIGNQNDFINFSANSVTSATSLELLSGAGVTENGFSLTVGTLTAVAPSVTLNAPDNFINVLGPVTAVGDILFDNNQPFTVSGALGSTAGTVSLFGSGMTLAADIDGPTVSLTDSNFIQQVAGIITATNLDVTVFQPGDARLPQAPANSAILADNNVVTNLTSVDVAGDFQLTTTQNLNVTGNVFAGGNVTLTAADINLVSGVLNAQGLDLVASGAIVQTGDSLEVTRLSGSAASADFTGAPNTVNVLGNFTTAGDFRLDDEVALQVAGTVSATSAGSTIALQSSGLQEGATSQITVDGSGTLSANAGLVSLQADRFDLISGGKGDYAINGNIAAFDLFDPGTFSVGVPFGNFTPTLNANQLGFITAGTLALGSLNGAAADATVQALTIAAKLTLTSATPTLGLFSGGGISALGANDITAGTLIGAAGGDVTLSATANSIATLGNFAVSTGNFVLDDTGPLAVAGNVSVTLGNTTLNAASLNFNSGTVTTGTLTLGATGAVAENGGVLDVATLTGAAASANLASQTNAIGTLGAFTASTGSLFIVSTGTMSIAGNVTANAGGITLQAGGLNFVSGTVSTNALDLLAGGAITESGGVIDATSLTGSAASANLISSGNAIPLLDAFTASTGDFGLATGGNLTVAGPLSVPLGNIDIIAGNALSVTGPLTGNDVTLSGGTGGINLSSQITATSLFFEDFGALTQTGGIIQAGTLTGTATSISLPEANRIASIAAQDSVSGVTATAGSVTISEAALQQLALNGVISASAGQAITLNTDLLVFGTGAQQGEMFAAGGQVVLNPVTLGRGIELIASGTADPNALSISQTGLDGIFTGTLVLGSATAGNINIGNPGDVIRLANGNFVVSTLDLLSGVGVTENGAGLIVGTLTGAAPAAALNGPQNQIAVLADFTLSSGDFSLTDALPGQAPLVVDGAVGVTTGHTISLVSDALSLTAGPTPGSLSAPSGVVSIAPLTPGRGAELVAGGTANPGVLSLSQADLDNITTGTLIFGDSAAGAILIGLSGDAIDLTGHAGTLDLLSAAAITEGGTLAVGVLEGAADSAALGGANLVGTLAAFATRTGFELSNAQDLIVTGPVTDLVSAAVQSTGNLTVSGDVTAPDVSLAANGALSVTSGTVDAAGTLVLTGGTIGQTGGTVTAGLLTGSATGSVDLGDNGGSALVGTLGAFASQGGFVLNDGQALTIAGPVTDTQSVALLSSAGMVVAGDIGAPDISLTAADGLSVTGGNVDATATLLLSAATIAQTGGTLTADTLTGNASGTAQIGGNGGTALIGTLGAFTSFGGFALIDGQALFVAGPVTDSVSVALQSAAALSVAGDITAPDIALTAGGALALASGTVDAAGTLVLTGGTIGQTGGTVTAGLLTGSATGSVDLGDNGGSALVGTLGAFASQGGFVLNDGQALTVAGPVTDTQSVALQSSAGMVVAGDIGAPDISLTASDGLSVTGGNVDATATLLLSAATIAQTGGTLTADTLTGNASGTAQIGGNGGTALIGTLGAFASDGGFVLNDGQALFVAGPVTDSVSVALLSAAGLTVDGSLTAPDITLTAGGALALAGGAVNAAGTLALTGATIDQTGGALTAGLLTGSAGGTASLGENGGTASVATLGSFASQGGFVLNDGVALVVTGAVTDSATIALQTAAGLTIAGSVTAPDISLAAAGAIAFTGGALNAAGTLSLAGASIAQSGGTVSAGTLTGGAAGAAQLGGGGGTALIGVLGAFATQGGFTLTDGESLIVAGPVTDSQVVHLASSDDINVDGAITAPDVSLAAAGVLALAGNVGASGTLTLDGHTIGQTGGVLNAAVLTGDATGTVRLGEDGGSLMIGTLGNFASAGGFALNNGQALDVAGRVTDTTMIALQSAADMTICGTVAAPDVSLVAAGALGLAGGVAASGTLSVAGASLAQTGGDVTAGVLTGTTEGATQLGNAGGTATIGTLADFSAGSLNLADSSALVITGALTAPALNISAVGAVTLADGTITTTGAPLSSQHGAVPDPEGSNITVLADGNGQSEFLQTGTSILQGGTNGNATLRIDATNLSFTDLVAPDATLVLSFGTGRATGTMHVGGLRVVGSAGSSNLFGSVGGVGGQAAASVAQINPSINVNDLFNGCIIGYALCGGPPSLPEVNLQPDVALASLFDSAFDLPAYETMPVLYTVQAGEWPADPDVQLPNISDRDY